MSGSHAARAWLAPLALAVIPTLLAVRFGGFHPRHAGWAVLALATWACVEGARGRLSALRSPGGIATAAMVALAAWTAASISWADATRHDAWVEAMRAAGYAAAFIVGGAALAGARSFARYAALAAAGVTLVAALSVARIAGDAPLRSFVAGRMDWPIGYAPALAGMCLFAMLLLLGIGSAAEQRWAARRGSTDLVVGGAALAAATLCAAVAVLAQSRGTIPALLVGVVVSLVAMPRRATWLLRLGAIAALLLAARDRLSAPYQAQFDLRQAPFTEGADADALLQVAEDAARDAGAAIALLVVVAALVGVACVPLAGWLAERIHGAEQRLGTGLLLPTSIAAAALVLTLLVVGGDRSPLAWASDQWRGCVDPPELVGDPGSGGSYFANTGTGRCDYYRVALQSAADEPLLGLGAGNFRSEYVRERETREEPRVVHSLPLQLLAELGVVGAALGALVLGCIVVAVGRFVRSGSSRDATFAGAIGAIGYWTAHSSIDWLWQLPAVTLPAVALAGGLVACVSRPQQSVALRTSALLAAGVFMATVALVLPVTMADSRLRTARDPDLQERDPNAALLAARDARAYDPTWAEAAITEAALHAAAGRREEAATAARRAVELEPRSWSVQYRASGLIGLDDTAEGRAAFERARELNPQLPADVPEDDEAVAEPSPDALQPAG